MAVCNHPIKMVLWLFNPEQPHDGKGPMKNGLIMLWSILRRMLFLEILEKKDNHPLLLSKLCIITGFNIRILNLFLCHIEGKR
jgi:hypothetical protein